MRFEGFEGCDLMLGKRGGLYTTIIAISYDDQLTANSFMVAWIIKGMLRFSTLSKKEWYGTNRH